MTVQYRAKYQAACVRTQETEMCQIILDYFQTNPSFKMRSRGTLEFVIILIM